ncbi:MAG: ABC transporter substrate-binding protein [Dehalococcoidia bacterium]
METLSRRSLFALAGGLAAAALVGCSEDDEDSSSTATAQASGGSGTATASTTSSKFSGVKPAAQISYWSVHPANSKAVEEELIKRFQAKYPDIKVNLVTAGANYAEVSEKFNAGLAARQVPDVVMLSDVWWFKYYLAKTIAPLDDLISEVKLEVSDYQDTLINDYKYQGKQWAMPFARSTPLFYYNKDKWAEAGLPDRGPQTWSEMDEWGAKLQAKAGANQFAFTHVKGDSYIAWTFQGIIWQYGGHYSDEKFNITLDTPEAIAAGNYVRDQVFGKKYANVTANSETADFIAGQTASILSSTGGLAGVLRDAKFPVGTAFYPIVKQFGCPTGGAGLAIPEAIPDANKVAAMTFLKFLGEPDSTAYYSQNVGYMPVRKSAITGPMADFLKEKPQFKTAIDQLPKTQPQDSARVYIPGGDAILGKGLERMLLNNEDAKAVWPDVAAQLKKAYEQDVKPKLSA